MTVLLTMIWSITVDMMKMRKLQRIMMIFGGTIFLSFLILFSNRALLGQFTVKHKSHSAIEVHEFKSLMEERTSLVASHCANRSHRATIKTGEDLYSLPGQSLVWCPVYKAASSNWFHNLLSLSGLSDYGVQEIKEDFPDLHPNMLAREVAPVLPYQEIKEIILQPGSTRFLIVRHPFDRLVSAFRDKLERIGDTGHDYYNKYGKNIVKTYREKAMKRFGQDFFSKENNFGAPLLTQGERTSKLPSWWEFIQWILKNGDHPERFDVHWRPVSVFCSICVVQYNYILHFENLEQEELLFVEELNTKAVITPRWDNRNDMGLVKKDIVNTYFSLLDEQDVVRLYQLYKDDFLMFGYEFQYNWLKFNHQE